MSNKRSLFDSLPANQTFSSSPPRSNSSIFTDPERGSPAANTNILFSGTPQNAYNRSAQEQFPTPSGRTEPSMEEEPEYAYEEDTEPALANVVNTQDNPNGQRNNNPEERKDEEVVTEIIRDKHSHTEHKLGGLAPIPHEEEEKIEDISSDEEDKEAEAVVYEEPKMPSNYIQSYHKIYDRVDGLKDLISRFRLNENEEKELIGELEDLESKIEDIQKNEEKKHNNLSLQYSLRDLEEKIAQKKNEIVDLLNDQNLIIQEIEFIKEAVEKKEQELKDEKGEREKAETLKERKRKLEVESQEKQVVFDELKSEMENIKTNASQSNQKQEHDKEEIVRLEGDITKLKEETLKSEIEQEELKEECYNASERVNDLEKKMLTFKDINLKYDKVTNELDAFTTLSEQQEATIRELNQKIAKNNDEFKRTLRQKMEKIMEYDEKLQETQEMESTTIRRNKKLKRKITELQEDKDSLVSRQIEGEKRLIELDQEYEGLDGINKITRDLMDKKEKYSDWEQELEKITILRERVIEVKRQTIKMIEESKVEEEEYKKLEKEHSRNKASYEEDLAEFRKQKILNVAKKQKMKNKIAEVEWRTKKETNYFSAFSTGFIPTVIALGLILIYYYGASSLIKYIKGKQ